MCAEGPLERARTLECSCHQGEGLSHRTFTRDSIALPRPGGYRAVPNTQNAAPLHEVKVEQPPVAELQPAALPRLLHCHGSRALHPASPRSPGLPAPRCPLSPPAAAGVAGRARSLSCLVEGGRSWGDPRGAAGRAFPGRLLQGRLLQGGALAS